MPFFPINQCLVFTTVQYRNNGTIVLCNTLYCTVRADLEEYSHQNLYDSYLIIVGIVIVSFIVC